MIGLDTNILVRYFVLDDPRQTAVATALIDSLTAKSPAFVAQAVLAELVWVLDRSYGVGRTRIGQIIEHLLNANEVAVENAAPAHRALLTFRSTSADFVDALIAAVHREAGCGETLTFDKNAAASAGMRLLKT